MNLKLFLPPLCALFLLSAVAAANPEAVSAQQRPSRPLSRYVKANGIRVHYLEWAGKGTPVVLVHGLYDTAQVWSSIATRLATNHRVPMTFAASKPSALRSLVFIEGGFYQKPEPPPAGPPPSTPCKAEPPVCARVASLEKAVREYDADALYPRVTAPTLLIIGEPANLPADLEELVKNAHRHADSVANQKLPRGKMAVVKNANHWVQKDQPKEVAKVIEDFLASVNGHK